MSARRVVCVLSGGGAKAAAHVGAHRALEERGIRPAHYVGTSMGAVLAAAFASGLDYDDVLRRVTAITRPDVASPSPTLLLGPFARSLLRPGPLRDTIRRLVPARHFSDLHTPLTVTAVDAGTGELVLFGEGGRSRVPLVDALYASCALPVYYPPAVIGDRRYADGGLRAVLPVDLALLFRPDLVFAVMVGPSFYDEPPEDPQPAPPFIRAHNDAMRILMAAQTEETLARWKRCDVPLVLVRPPLDRQATFEVSAAVRYVEAGYANAVRALDGARGRTSPAGAAEEGGGGASS